MVARSIAASFVLVKPFEFAFMPIAMLLRSVPLVAMAPVLLLIFGQGKLGIAAIGAIVVLFPALVNMVLGLRSASPLSLDLIKVNGGSDLRALLMVRVRRRCRISSPRSGSRCPGAIVGAMLAEWLTGFTGLGGILSDYKGRGNFAGVWAIVVVSVVTSIIGYASPPSSSRPRSPPGVRTPASAPPRGWRVKREGPGKARPHLSS